jgi:predicted nucleic acid-binding protein
MVRVNGQGVGSPDAGRADGQRVRLPKRPGEDIVDPVLSHNVEVPEHQFWRDSNNLREALERMPAALTGHRQITDAYLVALAIHHKGKLATLDRGFSGGHLRGRWK